MLLAFTLFGCPGTSDPPVDDSGFTGDTGTTTEPTEDTGFTLTDMGSMVIWTDQNTGRTNVAAVFVEAYPGFPNFARCVFDDTVSCIPALPDIDNSASIPENEFDATTVITRFVGWTVQFGPYELMYRQEDDDEPYSFYTARVDAGDPLPSGWIGATWGGMWEDYESDDDLYIGLPIELQRPAPGSKETFPNNTRLPIEWVPTGEGEVYLQVAEKYGDSLIFRLEDDGYHEFDVDELNLGQGNEELEFQLQRWHRSQVRRDGHLVEMVSVSTSSFAGFYFNIGQRDEVRPADGCSEAQGQDPTPPGEYWGQISSFDADDNPACTGFSAAASDGLLKVELQPRESLSLEYTLKADSASVYVLEDCNNENTCLAGIDEDPYDGVPEQLQTFNGTDDPMTVYIGLDGTQTASGVFTLDFTIESLLEPNAYDTCSAAMAGVPLSSGTYFSNFTGYGPDINPGSGGCTGTSLGGPDLFIPIKMEAFETVLDVSVNMDSSDVGIYLLYNCNDPFSNPPGSCSDVGFNQVEGLTYTKVAAGEEIVYLVVDSTSTITPYFLNIALSP